MVRQYKILLIMSSMIFCYYSSVIPEVRRCTIYSKEGWKCNDGSCIPKQWICDKDYQCENVDDKSDEEEGCNLYPETECKSWHGDKYVKCADIDACVIFENSQQVLNDCSKLSVSGKNKSATSSDCDTSLNSKRSKWRCTDGLCIDMNMVCDGKKDCDDESDEDKGCQMYGRECKSWGGLKHEKCRVLEGLSFTDSFVCTLPSFNDKNNTSACRKCHEKDKWRCDDGFCIDIKKHRDGIPDCDDGSDEKPVHLRMWKGVIITMLVTGGGICLSFFYRFFIGRKRRCKKCAYCLFEARAALMTSLNKESNLQLLNMGNYGTMENEEAVSSEEDLVDFGHRMRVCSNDNNFEMHESPNSENNYSKHKPLPIELIELLESRNIQNQSKESKVHKKELAQHLYAKVHQVSYWYRNLYYYFFMRCDSSKSLQEYTSQFHNWEMQFHNGKPIEALKCWRLHLGSCEILKALLNSLEAPGILDRILIRCLPIRNALRNLRFRHVEASQEQNCDQNEITVLRDAYTVCKCIWYSLKPFLGASFLYFDLFKDVCLAVLMFSVLKSLTNGDIFSSDYEFEAILFITLVGALLMVQICWMLITAFYAIDIFGICKEWSIRLRSSLGFLSIFLAPIMPAFVLANHAYYREETHSLRRNLQTLGKKRYALYKAMFRVITINDTLDDTVEKEIDYKNWLKSEKVKLFEKISEASFKAKYFRRIYSFYRIVHAVFECYCVITVLVLILMASETINKPNKFLEVLSGKLSVFIGFQESSFEVLQILDLPNIIIWSSILYSTVMLLTALARYVYQSKSTNLSKVGQLILGLYFFCHLVTRLTITIAIFSTAEASSRKNNGPTISKLPASIIIIILFIMHFGIVYLYKYKFIQEFKNKNNFIERSIHVLANTLVVIPFTTWDAKGPIEEKSKYSIKDTTRKPRRSESLNELLQIERSRQIGHRKTFSTGNIPDIELVMKEIEILWWKNPTKKLKLFEVKQKFRDGNRMGRTEDINKAFEYLESEGFINKRLYNPRRTKKEYFWLLTIHLFLNCVALCIEGINGGIQTSKGEYISWDVRLLSFSFGLLFLCLYYKKFHVLKDLTRVHICQMNGMCCKMYCCFREDRPMHAIPDYEVLQKCLQPPEINALYRTVETQTSNIDLSKNQEQTYTNTENLTDKPNFLKLLQIVQEPGIIKPDRGARVVENLDKVNTESQTVSIVKPKDCNGRDNNNFEIRVDVPNDSVQEKT